MKLKWKEIFKKKKTKQNKSPQIFISRLRLVNNTLPPSFVSEYFVGVSLYCVGVDVHGIQFEAQCTTKNKNVMKIDKLQRI